MTTWCPLSGKDCREDCGWADIVDILHEDGVERQTFCAITQIAAFLLVNNGGMDEDGWADA